MLTTKEARQALSMLTLGGQAAGKTHVNMTTSNTAADALDTSMQQKLLNSDVREVAEQVKNTAKEWLRDRGIQGIGISKRKTNGIPTNELALKIYVKKKLPKSKQRKTAFVPKHLQLSKRRKLRINDKEIPIDVEEIGELKLESNTSYHKAPVKGGASIFYKKIKEAGTLGCVVRKRNTESPLYILSNSHVIANQSTGEVGDPILQPGRGDFEGKEHEIARLYEWVEFQFKDSELLNTCDAAIAKVIGRRVSPLIYGLENPISGTNFSLRRGMKVKKSGRSTTLETEGVIKDVDFMTPALKYKKPNGKTARIRFHHQVLCSQFTKSGDSGSAVLDKKNRVVGLHFAGSESVSVFNRIGFVLNTFNIEIVTGQE